MAKNHKIAKQSNPIDQLGRSCNQFFFRTEKIHKSFKQFFIDTARDTNSGAVSPRTLRRIN